MKDLTALLEKLGASGVKTYIQSGNAVFRHRAGSASELSDRIRTAIKENHGFEPQVFLLDLVEMEEAIASNPFPEAESEPKTLHLYFLAAAPKNPDLKALDSFKQDNEQFKLINNVFYLARPMVSAGLNLLNEPKRRWSGGDSPELAECLPNHGYGKTSRGGG